MTTTNNQSNPTSTTVDLNMYVATNLSYFVTDHGDLLARDVIFEGVTYRQLDTEFYTWLRYKMGQVKKLNDHSRVSDEDYNEIKDEYSRIRSFAKDHFGANRLITAWKIFDPENYIPPGFDEEFLDESASNPPSPYLIPEDGSFPFTHPVAPEDISKVDTIKDEAQALGWMDMQLYQNRGRFAFPCGQDYGLVCFLAGEKRIGEVTKDYIEILSSKARGIKYRFFNPLTESANFGDKNND